MAPVLNYWSNYPSQELPNNMAVTIKELKRCSEAATPCLATTGHQPCAQWQ